MYHKWIHFLLGMSLLVGFSPSLLANKGNDCCPYLEVGLTGGWFSALHSDTAYGIAARNINDITPTGKILEMKPKYKFGGGIALNYQMADCCYNWGATYFGLRSNNNRTNGGIIGLVLAPINTFPFGAYGYAVNSSFKSHYDFANIELGSTLCVVTDCLSINPKIGVSYARFRHQQRTTYSGGPGGFFPFPSAVITETSTFKGLGPSMGVDVNYMFCEGFSLIGNLRYSALIGNIQGNYSADIGSAPAVAVLGYPASQSFDTKRHFAKLFQSELGIGYTFNWCDYCGNIVLGYQLTNGWNAAKKISRVDDIIGGRLINRALDAGFYGPFLRLTMRFGM